ncbi:MULTISPECIES: DUF5053 domain-containing protein [Segatella]
MVRDASGAFCAQMLSASWLYHKLDGIDGNGGVGSFTEEEKNMLRGALCEVSNRIRAAADRI